MKSIEKTNTLEDQKGKMTLRDYFLSLPETNIVAPRRKLMESIARQCNVPLTTVRSWFVYGIKPRDNKEQVIEVLAKETGISPEDMWDD
jgi:hypothetical protein